MKPLGKDISSGPSTTQQRGCKKNGVESHPLNSSEKRGKGIKNQKANIRTLFWEQNIGRKTRVLEKNSSRPSRGLEHCGTWGYKTRGRRKPSALRKHSLGDSRRGDAGESKVGPGWRREPEKTPCGVHPTPRGTNSKKGEFCEGSVEGK